MKPFGPIPLLFGWENNDTRYANKEVVGADIPLMFMP
jgi:hypothetical protein